MKTKHTIKFPIKIFVFVVILYLFFAEFTRYSLFYRTQYSYYNFLIESIIKGKSNIHYLDSFQDLSLFKQKYYLYWGPAPILFISLFYIFLGGIKSSDVFYTVVAGIINVILFYILAREFIKFFKLSVSQTSVQIVLLSFAFASPNFFSSLTSGVWQTSQAIAVMYLLVSLIFYFKFLINSKYFIALIISILFFNLAWLSRYGIAWYSILFIYIFLYFKNDAILFKRIISIFSIITAVFVLLFFTYNFMRFGNIFNTGIKYLVVDTNIKRDEFEKEEAHRVWKLTVEDRKFSASYIPQNIYYYFLNPIRFSLEKPYILIDKMGNGIFFVYPILFSLFFIRKKLFSQVERNRNLLFIFFLISGIHLFILLIYGATGWPQFGSRYVFEIIPLLFLLVLFCINSVPIWMQYTLMLFGIFINVTGMINFFNWIVR